MAGRAASTRRDREAADWFVRLSGARVSARDMEAFQAWRGDPACREAYARVEQAWIVSGQFAADADVHQALAAIPDRRGRARVLSTRGVWAGALIAATAAAVVVGGYLFNAPTRYATGVGERRAVRLVDGSRLQLDTDSRVDVAFKASRRDLTLVRGQALFDVAHDPARPLVVVAGEARVRAIGTRFTVRRTGRAADVTLVEGRVDVTDRARVSTRWTLRPGERLSLRAQAPGAAIAPRPVDVGAATSWTRGRLVFDATPLGEAIAEVNRYTERDIALESEVDPASPISGAFVTDDAAAFAEAVASIHGLRATGRPDGTITLGPSVR